MFVAVALAAIAGMGSSDLVGPPTAAAAGEPEPRGGAVELFRFEEPTLDESSGLAVSARHDGIIWTHNDGGRVARVLAVDRRGRTRARVTLRGVDPYDPEALAPGRDRRGRPALYLGDIGDNLSVRRDVSVLRFAEPGRLASHRVSPEWFRLRYPDGPQDAEALLVDPRDNRVWVATKDLLRGALYRAPVRMSTRRTNVLERVAVVPGLITDGAFLPDGRFVLRSYATVYLYGAPGKLEDQAPLPDQEQGESIAVDGDRLLVGSEGRGSAVYAVPVPRSVPSAGSSADSPAPRASPQAPAAVRSTRVARPTGAAARSRFARLPGDLLQMAVVAAPVVALASVAVLARSRRRRATRHRR